MRELKVMTLGRQLSLVHSSKKSSASFQSPAFSHALIRLLYVITLRSHPCCHGARQPHHRAMHLLPIGDYSCMPGSEQICEGCH